MPRPHAAMNTRQPDRPADPTDARNVRPPAAAPLATPLLAWEPPRVDRLGALQEITGGIVSLS